MQIASLLDPQRVRAVLAARAAAADMAQPPAPVAAFPGQVAQVAPASDDLWEAAGTAPVKQSAVLVGLLTGPSPGVLLTRRAANLRLHAGQVAFPGGRMDPEDAHPEATALREAEEEIGLAPAHVHLLGRLPGIRTGTGYHITPVVGLIDVLPPLRLAPAEVDSVFTLPMAVLCDPAAPERRRAEFDGKWRSFWVWPHDNENIWGATAAILVELAAALTASG